MTLSIEIIAHRGYSAEAPENTLAALERALEAGADAVEFDLHVAACGTPVLAHDDTLERTTNGTGALAQYSYEELRTLDVGGWFGPDFAGEQMASLEQALALLKGRVGRIYAEIKAWREPADLDRMLRIAQDADLAYDTVFISMDWRALERIASLDDSVGIGYIVERRDRWDEAVRRASPSPRALVDLDYRLVLAEPDLVARAAQKDVETAVWTVDEPDEAEQLVQAGVRRLTTNQVERLQIWLEGRGPASPG
jgi:glycerophosphoryl diester phosphodiesterase